MTIKRPNASGITKTGTAISDVPDAPTIGTATAGNQSATVPFTAAVTGGTPTNYTATSTPGSVTGSNTSSPISVTGLTAGTSYTFTVVASNSTGTSAASSASNAVTPTSPLYRGIIGGGQFTPRMSYINFASAGDDVFFGNLSTSRLGPGAVGSSTRGIWSGGAAG